MIHGRVMRWRTNVTRLIRTYNPFLNGPDRSRHSTPIVYDYTKIP